MDKVGRGSKIPKISGRPLSIAPKDQCNDEIFTGLFLSAYARIISELYIDHKSNILTDNIDDGDYCSEYDEGRSWRELGKFQTKFPPQKTAAEVPADSCDGPYLISGGVLFSNLVAF